MYIDMLGHQLAFKEDIVNPNLLSNTTMNSSNDNWSTPVGGADMDRLVDGSKRISGAKTFIFYNNDAKGTISLKENVFLPSDTYTFSCEIFNKRQTSEKLPFKITAKIDGKEIELAKVNISAMTSWHKISASFNVSGLLSSISFNVMQGIPAGGMGMTNWKLEKGTFATEWCPSVLDYFSNLGGKALH